MKKRYTWKEFEAAALKSLGGENPHYIKLYNYEPEGDHYDFPDFVEIDGDV